MASGNVITSPEKQSWPDKVLRGDDILQQVTALLAAHGKTLPQTPRRPDVRLIVENVSGDAFSFQNPGDHSNKPERIPSSGDATAVMIMLKGDTLDAQQRNAKTLCDTYHLDALGLTGAFIDDMAAGKLGGLVAEAYGPAPFAAQAERLIDLDWEMSGGTHSKIPAHKGAHAAYGARAATLETVFLAKVRIYVQGTGTTPELVEGDGMAIAVDTKADGMQTTRPIAPSVARTYYGAHADTLPQVAVDPDGHVISVDPGKAPARPKASASRRGPAPC